MFLDFENDVAIVLDQKIEPDIVGCPRLPDAPRFIVFLGAKRRVADVFQQKSELLFKCFPNTSRQTLERALEMRRAELLHLI